MLWLSATWDAFDEAKKDSIIKMISNQTDTYLSAVTNCFIARYRLQKIDSFKPSQFIIEIGLSDDASFLSDLFSALLVDLMRPEHQLAFLKLKYVTLFVYQSGVELREDT